MIEIIFKTKEYATKPVLGSLKGWTWNVEDFQEYSIGQTGLGSMVKAEQKKTAEVSRSEHGSSVSAPTKLKSYQQEQGEAMLKGSVK